MKVEMPASIVRSVNHIRHVPPTAKDRHHTLGRIPSFLAAAAAVNCLHVIIERFLLRNAMLAWYMLSCVHVRHKSALYQNG